MAEVEKVMMQAKDKFYDMFLKEPSKETFCKFINQNFGEQNDIEFKEQWIEEGHLVKTILAMANSRGGIIVFGIKEKKGSGILDAVGLESFVDKAKINDGISKYVSSNLNYEILDFEYNDKGVYPALCNKKFQILFVYDVPSKLPFMSKKAGVDIEKDIIYVRHGTKCEKATVEDIDKIIYARLNSEKKEYLSDMSLEHHLKQLKLLYSEVPEKIDKVVRRTQPTLYDMLVNGFYNCLIPGINYPKYEHIEIDNLYCPKETYEAFIANAIEEKKERIRKVLDI